MPHEAFDRFVIRCRLPRGDSRLPHAPLYFSHDRDGHLVSFARVGMLDLVGVHQELGDEAFLAAFAFCLEHTRQALLRHQQATGAEPQIVAVVDLSGFGQHCVPPMRALTQLLAMFQDNFPEILHKAVVVRAPWLFHGVWQVMVQFLNEKLVEKISQEVSRLFQAAKERKDAEDAAGQ